MGDEQLKSSSQKMSRLQNAAPSIYEAATIASTCGCTSKLNPPFLSHKQLIIYLSLTEILENNQKTTTLKFK